MENATLQVLSKCNITPKYKGYTYLPVAVRLADQYMREPLCIMADIYPVIGQIYDESPRKVERAIRKVVEVVGRTTGNIWWRLWDLARRNVLEMRSLLMHLCITYSTVIHSQL